MPSVLDQLRSFSSTILRAPRHYFRAIHRDLEEPDSHDPAVFSLAEIKRMGKRQKKFPERITEEHLNLPLSDLEWENLEQRKDWDEFDVIYRGKKRRILAKSRESTRGFKRSGVIKGGKIVRVPTARQKKLEI